MQQLYTKYNNLSQLPSSARELIQDIAADPTWRSKLFAGLCTVLAGGFLANYAMRPDDPVLSYTATYIDKTDVANPTTHTEVTNLDPVAAGVFAVVALVVFAWVWHLHKNAQNAPQTLQNTYNVSPENIKQLVSQQKKENEEASCCSQFIGCFQ